MNNQQERERFEAWWWKRHPDYTSELLKRTSKSGAYDSDWVNGMWLAWEAGAALHKERAQGKHICCWERENPHRCILCCQCGKKFEPPAGRAEQEPK